MVTNFNSWLKASACILCCLIFSQCNSPAATEAETVADTDRLLGSWDLVQWTGTKPDGTVIHPYGTQAYGMLIYTSEGTAVLSLSKGDRPVLGSDDYQAMSRDTLLEAYSGFFSYHGTYKVDEVADRVIHKVEACKIPDWVGREQVRLFSFKGDSLILRAEKVIGLEHELIWTKR